MRWSFFVGIAWADVRPIQLVKPVDNYSRLETTPEGLEFLTSIPGPVAIISAVGAIHTGKSFLLNQLCDSTTGFSVGYTVRPETHGIWAVKYPQLIPSTFGMTRYRGYGSSPDSQTTVIFLDTEGLFSKDASSSYDARLFAITTLLSSEVIYNTVKFIDTHHMEALETLIRRTNLFGLRAYAARGGGVQDRVTNLSEFLRLLVPSHLSWVVQDFVQDLENQEPEAWLHQLLSNEKSAGDSRVNNFFKSIDCVPLPIPANSHDTLQKLDTVNPDDLDPDYRQGIAKFRFRLLKRASEHPKLKTSMTGAAGGTPMKGTDVADLLQFLVDASNGASAADVDADQSPFPELPSVAEQFTKLQLRLMKSDILTIVERDLRQVANRQIQQNQPMCQVMFEQELNRQSDQAMRLWNATITGVVHHKSLSGPVIEAEQDFLKSLEESKEKLRQVNNELVREWCHTFLTGLLQELKTSVANAVRGEAKTPHDLEIIISENIAPIRLKYKATFNAMQGIPDSCDTDERQFSTQINHVKASLLAENEVLLKREIDEANKAVLTRFTNCAVDGTSPLPEMRYADLTEKLQECRQQAMRDLDTHMNRYPGVNILQIHKIEASKRIEQEQEGIMKKWVSVCADQARRFIHKAQTNLQMEIRRSVPFPSDTVELTDAIKAAADDWRNRYQKEVICAKTDEGRRFDYEFESVVRSAQKSIEDANLKALKDIHSHVFDDLQKKLEASLQDYYWSPSFIHEAERRALEAIEAAWQEYDASQGNDEKQRGFSKDLLVKTAKNFVTEDLAVAQRRLNMTMITRLLAIGASVGLCIAAHQTSSVIRVLWVGLGVICTIIAASQGHVALAATLTWNAIPLNHWAAIGCGLLMSICCGVLTFYLTTRTHQPKNMGGLYHNDEASCPSVRHSMPTSQRYTVGGYPYPNGCPEQTPHQNNACGRHSMAYN